MQRLVAVLFVALLIAAGCGGDDNGLATDEPPATDAGSATTNSDEPSCSAADLSADPEEQPDLPDPVAIMRQQIINTATACNYDQLEELAFERDTEFTYSFGDEGSPAEYWRQLEEQGEEPLRFLVELLNRPHGVNERGDEPVYVWPSAFAYDRWSDVPDEDREALEPLYDNEDFEQFEQFGSYIGYRVGITADGDWTSFVAGD